MAKKNQRYRKQSQGGKFPWLLVMLGGGLLLLAAALFIKPGSGNAGGTPAIAVDQDRIDYGYIKFGGSRQFTLQVTNTGTGSLKFTEKPYIEVLEGC
ncbi:MAG: hypothetical protein ACM3XO_24450 [Bacteroidota bacterium]